MDGTTPARARGGAPPASSTSPSAAKVKGRGAKPRRSSGGSSHDARSLLDRMREEEAADDDSYEEAWAHEESWGSSSGGSWSHGRSHADSGSGWVSPGGSAYGRSPPHRCVTLRARADSLGGVEEAELQLALALSLSLSQNEVAPPATAEVAHSPGGSGGGGGGGSLGRPPRPPARPAPAPPPPHPGSYLRHAAAELSYERLCELEDVRPVAPEEAVAALPTLSWGEQGAEAEGGCCSICQMDYEEGETLLLLPCAHRMHAPCAREWLLKWSKRCPECKRSVQGDDDA